MRQKKLERERFEVIGKNLKQSQILRAEAWRAFEV